MYKIILITCYFGRFPWYFRLFIKSCRYNPTVEFLIFSDADPGYDLPPNVTLVPFGIDEFNRLATRKLGLDIRIREAYKLCDFKPAYGVIFSDYIEGYDFWGITDIDIVFGRIREFMTTALLHTYEVVSVRDDYPTGSFMLFRNTDKINKLYTLSRDYQKVFASEKHYCFDECNFKHYYLQEGGDIFKTHCDIESMHHVLKKEEQKGLAVHFDFLIIEGLPGALKWDSGVLSFKNEYEVLMHHLILYKANRYTRKKVWKEIPDTFYIDRYTIRRYSTRSVRGKIHSFIRNTCLPGLKKAGFAIDSYMAHILGRKVKGLSPAVYELNGIKVRISKNDNGENQVSFQSIRPVPLVKSLWYPERFYSRSVKQVRCRIAEGKLTEYHINGGKQTFKLSGSNTDATTTPTTADYAGKILPDAG